MSRTCIRATIALAVLPLLAAAAVIAAPSAAAHSVTYPSTIEILGFGNTSGEGPSDYAWGIVRSGNPKCVGGRTVELKREISGQLFTIDTDLTSTRGFWAAGGDPELGQGGVALLVKERVGKRKGHRHVCSTAAEVFD